MKKPRPLITFTTNAEINRALEKERKRLARVRPGEISGQAAAVRSLIMRGSKAKANAEQ